MNPLITVITVCYNSEDTIAKTIESVLCQKLDMVEYLIIDGKSTDSTVDIIKQYEPQFHGNLKWISERDDGWYDAMNKGIRLAKGKFVNFLNSDDYFESDAIENTMNFINENGICEEAIVYGNSTNIYMNSKGKKLFRLITAPNVVEVTDKKLRDGMCGVRHQSMFTGINVFKRVGILDLDYRLHADWNFFIKCVRENVEMYHLDKNLTFYSMYGVSSKPDYKERHRIRKSNDLYRYFDFDYYKDFFGIKTLSKHILGEKLWNDLLFMYHNTKGG